ncbi:MAG: flagellar hook-basal body protein [Phycisphaerales bacterium]|nr:flagellar hook-basal body protein [Phycisphaerales bacterium]
MNYGLQISASGAQTALYRQDVFANNLANINTVGFKPDIPSARQRPAVRQEDNLPFLPSNDLLERLGGGLQLATPRTSFEQGSLESTSSPLDLAIKGDGFFLVRAATSDSTDRLRLTRDGAMTLDGNGRLVLAGTGMPVLDVQNRPIQLDTTANITVGADAVIRQDGIEVAQLRIVDVPDRTRLTKVGKNLYNAPADAISSAATATGAVVQFSVERSAVDSINALMDMQDAGRSVQANLAMIRSQDRLLERAIGQFGRVA